MTDTIRAYQAEMLIWIIAALIPLLIWAVHDADRRFAAKRTYLRQRRSR